MSFKPQYATHCLKEQGQSSVWLVTPPDGSKQIIKQWSLTPAFALKLLFGMTQPQRQRRGTRRLFKAGVKTSQLPRMGWKRYGAVIKVTLCVEYIEGAHCLELLQENRIDELQARHIGQELGKALQKIADAGFFNRDIKLSNIIVGPGQKPDVSIIDPVGVRLSHNKEVERERMIERLGCELVDTSIHIPRSGWITVIRHSLRNEPTSFRRAVFERLRTRRGS